MRYPQGRACHLLTFRGEPHSPPPPNIFFLNLAVIAHLHYLINDAEYITKNREHKMDMSTDRLIIVERKMLHFERELHIVKQTTTQVCPTAYCTATPSNLQSILCTAEASSNTTTQPYHKSTTDHTISIITSTTSASSTLYKSRSPTEPLIQSLIC